VLVRCADQDHIIRSQKAIECVGVGDIIFIKGTSFPGDGAKGLVHRSPEKRYHSDGRVVRRVLLKVDIAAAALPPAAAERG